MGRDALGNFFCDDDWDPVTRAPDEWTKEDEKRLKKKLDKPIKK